MEEAILNSIRITAVVSTVTGTIIGTVVGRYVARLLDKFEHRVMKRNGKDAK